MIHDLAWPFVALVAILFLGQLIGLLLKLRASQIQQLSAFRVTFSALERKVGEFPDPEVLLKSLDDVNLKVDKMADHHGNAIQRIEATAARDLAEVRVSLPKVVENVNAMVADLQALKQRAEPMLAAYNMQRAFDGAR